MAKKLTLEEEKKRLFEMTVYEQKYRSKGYISIAGIDEAGRGPLAGSVYAAAVILPEDAFIPGLNDSKKLSEKKREELFDIICKSAIAYSIQSVDEKIIDEINILNATFLAMNRAVETLEVPADFALIDGNCIQGMKTPHETIVKGDAKSISIAAASILAKVSRDRYIVKLAQIYPQYGFEKHKGYGTKAHTEEILKYGPCPIHRRTFLKKLLGESNE